MASQTSDFGLLDFAERTDEAQTAVEELLNGHHRGELPAEKQIEQGRFHDVVQMMAQGDGADAPPGGLLEQDALAVARTDVAAERLLITLGIDAGPDHPDVWICFFGHTHVPLLVAESLRAVNPPQRTRLDRQVRYLINPGSIGQPRDRVPLASFGVLDDEELVYEHYRVAYPIEKTQAKILAAGLAPTLAERLAGGW